MSDPVDTVIEPIDSVDPEAAMEKEHDDLATLLRKREHAKPNRFTYVVLGLLIVAVGFGAGAWAQSKWGASSSAGGGLPDFAAGGNFPAFGGAGAGTGTDTGTGTGGFAGGGFGGGATFGTVKLVDGSTLYITDASGNTVTVKVPNTATVTSQETVALSDLAAGDTVIIRGETADDGTVTAQSVSEGALPGGAAPSAAPTTTTQGDN